MIALALVALQGGVELVGEVPYERLATRAETRARMISLLLPSDAEWGGWHQLTPFPYAGHETDDFLRALPPEDELTRMGPNGPGPDLAAVYAGKNGVEARWQPLGDASNKMVDLHTHDDPELRDWAVCYLYVPIEARRATTVDVTCGSDDGIRFFLNGELLLSKDVPRGLDPEAERLSLELEEGTNHVLVKISEGVGDWAFQINTRQRLPGDVDALLQYYLDRDFPPSPERDHWRALTLPVPADLSLEVGGLALLADGTPLVATRRGDVWRVTDAYGDPPLGVEYRLFASGLHEPLGLAVRAEEDREAVYSVQRGELTRLVDEDGDGRADLYEAYCDAWGVSGNYHEFAFGPAFDEEGNAWVTLNVGFCGDLGKALVPWRGWAVKIAPDGTLTPVCDGLRSPNGLARYMGRTFYVDNQGDFVATNRLSELVPGSWHGHPASLRWRTDLESPGERPPRQPPAVWFPYKKMGQSAADVVVDDTGGRFGPFTGQLFVGDQTLASVMRVFLEEVEGHVQGACFPFLSDLDCGVNRLAFAPDGSLFVGQTDRGWGSVGRKSFGLQRVVYTGETPFDVLALRALEDGFELELTQDVDPATAADPASYQGTSYTYPYHAAYGAPEVDTEELAVVSAWVVGPRRVRLGVEPLRAGYVHELHADGLRAATGAALLHPDAYYTLVNVPGRAPATADEGDPPRALFLTHSAGYRHEVVTRRDPYVLSPAEERLTEAARGRFTVTATQDCARITADELAAVDVLVLFTTGDLPLPDKGILVDWVAAGGALVGVHSATDTFPSWDLWPSLIGAVFGGHPWTQEVRVNVEDGGHPATRHLEDAFTITDEIYQFPAFRRHPDRVLLSLDTDSVDASLGARADGDYPLAWWRDFGRGRVFYTALGHGADVWRDERFLAHLLGGMEWAVAGPDLPAPVPDGATVLFDGSGLDAWERRGGGAAGWTAEADGMTVAGGEGDLVSRASFGDALLHVEFAVPESGAGKEGQARGNSGVYVQGRYEVQVLDSFGLDPGEGDCAGLYGVKPPDVNACRRPGRWQSYDLRFRAPRFDAAGAKTEAARISVWHNGRLVHDDVELPAPTPGGLASDEVPSGPLLLQDHGDPVRYRNVWVLPFPAVSDR